MPTVGIRAAKTCLSRLVDAAAAGEDIVIARAGRPVARPMALEHPAARPRRRLGCLAGRVHIPVDFDAPLPDEVRERFARR